MIFAGADATITDKEGNINTVTRAATGDYTITFLDEYRTSTSYVLSGTISGKGFINEVTRGSTQIRILTYDEDGVDVDPNNVSVVISGKVGTT